MNPITESNPPCVASCPIDRAVFVRTATAALVGAAGALLLPNLASAQAIAPTKTAGKIVTYPIPAKDGAAIDDANGVMIARVKDTVFAINVICPHRATQHVEWLADKDQFHCPKHDSLFNPQGVLLDGKAKRSLDRYAAKRDGATIAVDTATLFQEDTQKEQWEKAGVSAS